MTSEQISDYLNKQCFTISHKELMELMYSSPTTITRVDPQPTSKDKYRYVIGTIDNINWEIRVIG